MVETLVAISILTIAVIGPLGIIAQALHTSYYTRDQMTAYYLAQEAIEYVKNLRDQQGIKITKQYLDDSEATLSPWLGDNWDNTTHRLFNTNATLPNFGVVGLPTTYSLIRNNGVYTFETCPSNLCNYLKKDANGVYGVTDPTGVDTQFRREIYFKRVDSSDIPQEFKMVVNVYWKSGSSDAKFTLEEYFTNSASKTGQ